MKQHPFIESTFTKKDTVFEVGLRPQHLNEFVGQELICERLNVMIGAARKRNETLGHCLFFGPPGLGKTTLATLLAKSMGTNLVSTSAPAIEKPGDLAGLLTTLEEGDVLFIDEIHRLNKAIEEYLYSAMEDFSIDILIDSGANARSVKLKLKPFTLACATTRQGMITAPLRSRFALTCRLDFYPIEALKKIILRTASLLNFDIDPQGLHEISSRSRGTPRIANNLLRWVRDFSEMKSDGCGKDTVVKALEMLTIDHLGLDEMDRKILEVIIEHYNGGPVGLKTVGIALGEDENTLEEVYEPYLILLGFLKRTPRGREATTKAYQHMNIIKKGEPDYDC